MPDLARLTRGGLLDDVLDANESQALPASKSSDPLQTFINKALAPHLQARQNPQLPVMLAQLDEAAGKLMRAILHHPDFQALEAPWRAMFMLVRGLETGSQLKVYLLNTTKQELVSERSGFALRSVLAGEFADNADDAGWAVVAANFSFDRSAADAAALRRLSRLLRPTGVPLIEEADLGGEAESGESESAWAQLRRAPDAPLLGLVLPRFLLRLPYGSATDPLERFSSEEMPGTPAHRDYLWGSPCFLCAQLLGEAFSDQGWRLRPELCRVISRLRLHVYEEAGEKLVRPCVELPLAEDDVDWALDQGYMPLIWNRGEDGVRLARWQSIAEPPARLAGRWA